jgi:type IV secretory pathway VirD2 relaxase
VPKKSDEREFRLRPNRPPKGGKSEVSAWSTALRTVFRYAGTSRRRLSSASGSSKAARKPFNQRCAIRITYTKNKIAGQWRAHGRYIAREGAAGEKSAGFSNESAGTEPSQALDGWQKEGDARLWKFIVSPEFGERVDLEQLTRELIQRMEGDLGTRLEWVAVRHFNTEHPHVHVALRGRRDDGSVLDLPREYVKAGIRFIAEDLCTRQLGYRTELDAREAERREVSQARVTSLDRIIERVNSSADSGYFAFQPTTQKPQQGRHLESRLAFLKAMDLADQAEPGTWKVRSDFMTVLKALQQTADRQRTLAANQALVSDPRLPLVVTEPRNIQRLEGRILGHGEDEGGRNFGRHYLLLEGVDAKIHLIYYTPELEESRSRGQLSANSFVRLQKQFQNGRPLLLAENLGDAEKLLKHSKYFREAARKGNNGADPTSGQIWGGWLGRYRKRVTTTSQEIAEISTAIEY